MNDGRNLLAEIVAMLFSFAAMAQFAATASPAKRRFLVDIMREAQASGVRIAAGEGLLSAYPFPSTDGYEPEDAMHLAVCLRALAMALYFRARLYNQPPGAHPVMHDGETPSGWMIVVWTRRTPALKVPLIDTS